MAEMNLKDYISRMHSGDREAFAAIYQELKQPVFTIVCRIVQSRELAEDVTQDVFLKLFTSPPDASVRSPRAWIFQMSRNLAIDTLRKKLCINLDEVELEAEDDIGSILIRMDLEAAIARLPREEREILSLRINGELHFHEISSIVGQSLPAVYRKYRKALKALRELLDGGAL